MRLYAPICGHVRPHAATYAAVHMHTYAAVCGQMSALLRAQFADASICFQMRAYAAICSHVRPYVSIHDCMRPYAAKGRPCCRHSELGDLWFCGSVRSCDHIQPYAAIYGHMQPYAGICRHMQPYASICVRMWLPAVICSQMSALLRAQ